MPTNGIKYSLILQDQALKKGNFWISTGDVDKGPTPSSGYYISITPPTGGYSVYLNKPTDGPSIYNPQNDTDLIALTSTLSGVTFATGPSALNWFNTQTDKMVCNIDYPPVVTAGLVTTIDAAFTPSYPRVGNTWYDLGMTASNGTLTNGPTYGTTGGGVIVFDGTDDYINIPTLAATPSLSLECFFNANSTAAKVLIYGPSMRPRISLRSNVVNVYYSTAQGTGDIIFTFSSISTGVFNQLVYTYDSVNGHQCYLNTVAGTRTSNGTALSAYPSYGSLQLGINPGGSDGAFSGLISTFRAYNRVLSSSEILQNYQAIATRYISLTVDYLVVAGGGGGGPFKGGGGGAGGLLSGTTTTLSKNTTYSIIIGSGGAVGTKGSNSVFASNLSYGGGNGGNFMGSTPLAGTGGAGGGPGGIHSSLGASVGAAGVTGQGFAGGANWNGVTPLVNSGGAGGGGAGMTGFTSTETSGASGGDGLYFSQYSTLGGDPAGWFSGGGGGGAPYNNNRGLGGKGGGGQGAQNAAGYGPQNAYSGTINTGGGGGGSSSGGGGAGYYDAKPGGSGIIILRIPSAYKANFSTGVTYSLGITGGYSYYKITATSTTSETVYFN